MILAHEVVDISQSGHTGVRVIASKDTRGLRTGLVRHATFLEARRPCVVDNVNIDVGWFGVTLVERREAVAGVFAADATRLLLGRRRRAASLGRVSAMLVLVIVVLVSAVVIGLSVMMIDGQTHVCLRHFHGPFHCTLSLASAGNRLQGLSELAVHSCVV